MAPRSYRLDTRAKTAAATRRRIRDAAIGLYRERGVVGTTIRAIAERADVARGTVMNHYGNAEQLLEAVLDEIVTEIRYPDARVQDGATSEAERVRRYVDAMFRFFVRSEDIWPAFSADKELPAMMAREQQFHEVVGRLHAATFGDLARDRIVAAATRAYVSYMPLHDLRAGGLSLDEAIEVVAETLIALVERRRTEVAMPAR
jgi:AcrR family transcriptional regulator